VEQSEEVIDNAPFKKANRFAGNTCCIQHTCFFNPFSFDQDISFDILGSFMANYYLDKEGTLNPVTN